MDYLRYSGQFLSRKGVTWQADIYQDADTPFDSIGVLRFPADNPLCIEWAHTDKENPLCGSTATLTVISPGDRTYEDLYTIRPGRIRLEILRDGERYWSGTLDPEFYEEPYNSLSEYEVSLTFSDLGILDRLKFNLTGMLTLKQILDEILTASRLPYSELRTDFLSLFHEDGLQALPSTLSIRGDNFYDEDGEPLSMKEVLEGILQPLGWRMIQRKGAMWLYDLNGLYTSAPTSEIIWASDDQTMGVDKVANNVTINFSTYAESKILNIPITYTGNESMDADIDERWIYGLGLTNNRDGFALFLSDTEGSGPANKYEKARYFHISPLLSGSECDGIAYAAPAGDGYNSTDMNLNSVGERAEKILMRSQRVFLPKITDQYRYRLKLEQEILLDGRFNPFETADKNDNGKVCYDWIDYRCNYIQIPASVTLYDEAGNALMHYDNEACAKNTVNPQTVINTNTEGEWKTGADDGHSCWLSWYNDSDYHCKAGVQGWQRNKHSFGLASGEKEEDEHFDRICDGQHIPCPPQSGFLEVCIWCGVWGYENTKGSIREISTEELKSIRWLLYKAPTIEIIHGNSARTDIPAEDIEYSGCINADAQEGIDIKTICGTSAEDYPTARGVFFDTRKEKQLVKLQRGNRTTQAEELLIGTLYSQYAERKTLLAGTTELLDSDMCTYTEQCQDGKRFICLNDVQNLIAGESSIEIVELRPDEYLSENE